MKIDNDQISRWIKEAVETGQDRFRTGVCGCSHRIEEHDGHAYRCRAEGCECRSAREVRIYAVFSETHMDVTLREALPPEQFAAIVRDVVLLGTMMRAGLNPKEIEQATGWPIDVISWLFAAGRAIAERAERSGDRAALDTVTFRDVSEAEERIHAMAQVQARKEAGRCLDG